ncbi:MAG: hypothetical protein QM742_00155 [Aquabacterium sp.]
MDVRAAWHEALSRRDPQWAVRLTDVGASPQPLYWHVVPVDEKGDLCRGVVIELYRRRDTDEVCMLCASYASTGGFVDVTGFEALPCVMVSAGKRHSLQADGVVFAGQPVQVQCRFEVSPASQTWRMQEVEVRAYAPGSAAPRRTGGMGGLFAKLTGPWPGLSGGHVWRWHTAFTGKQEGMAGADGQGIVQVPCPACFGRQASLNFAISKASYASGLSGYALYSENQVSGQTACRVCGGQGARYEPWFVQDYPEAVTETLFMPGQGCVPYQPMPLVQRFVPVNG